MDDVFGHAGSTQRGGIVVLLLESDNDLAKPVATALEKEGYDVRRAGTLATARQRMEENPAQVVVLDGALPDGPNEEFLEYLADRSWTPIVVRMAGPENDGGETPQPGEGPPGCSRAEALIGKVQSAVAVSRARALHAIVSRKWTSTGDTIGPPCPSQAMRDLYQRCARAARDLRGPALIVGEPGSGRHEIAKILHRLSPRGREAVVSVNCGDCPADVMEVEIFGKEHGPLPDFREGREGLFELVGAGTVILAGVELAPPRIQADLASLLRTKRFYRVGGRSPFAFHARILALAGEGLGEKVRTGGFSEDLYDLLRATEIRVPALRDRPEDISFLAGLFCERMARIIGKNVQLTPLAHQALAAYEWPGNVRELKGVIERAVLLQMGPAIGAESLFLPRGAGAPTSHERQPSNHGRSTESAFRKSTDPADFTMERAEACHIARVLEACGGNRSRAALALGIARSTLIRKIRELAIHDPDD